MKILALLLLAQAQLAMATECEELVTGPAVLEDRLFHEMLARYPETHDSFPVKVGEFSQWWSQRRSDPRPTLMSARGLRREELLSPGAEAHALSPDHSEIAFLERQTLHVHEILGNRDFAHTVHRVSNQFVWADDNRTIFFVGLDELERPSKLFRWEVGGQPELIYFERDPQFMLTLDRNGSGKNIYLTAHGPSSNEVRAMPGAADASLRVLKPRDEGVIYQVREAGALLVAVTPSAILNLRGDKILAASPGVTFEDLAPYRDFFVILERENGVPFIRIMLRSSAESWRLPMREELHDVRIHAIPDYDSRSARFFYSSPLTPETEFDYYLGDGKIRSLSVDHPGDIEPERYELIRSGSGFSLKLKGASGPLVAVHSVTAKFRPEIFSLLDRGFTVVFSESVDGIIEDSNSDRLERLRETAHEYAGIITRTSADRKPPGSPRR